MMYSHPDAEYWRVLKMRMQRRLWVERVIWAGVCIVFAIPMFTGGFH